MNLIYRLGLFITLLLSTSAEAEDEVTEILSFTPQALEFAGVELQDNTSLDLSELSIHRNKNDLIKEAKTYLS